MARDGQSFEWLVSNDENDVEPSAPRSVAFILANRLGLHLPARVVFENRAARCFIGGLTVFAAVVLFARVGANDRLPAAPVKPPQWLENRPITAPLSPFMAAECSKARCHALVDSGSELQRVRAELGSRYNVTAIRVRDSRGNLRGIRVLVTDAQGDSLTEDGVRVSEAPRDWDGESANLIKDYPTTRWVVRTPTGVWLVESHANSGKCDGDRREFLVLYGKALQRVRANQLSL